MGTIAGRKAPRAGADGVVSNALIRRSWWGAAAPGRGDGGSRKFSARSCCVRVMRDLRRASARVGRAAPTRFRPRPPSAAARRGRPGASAPGFVVALEMACGSCEGRLAANRQLRAGRRRRRKGSDRHLSVGLPNFPGFSGRRSAGGEAAAKGVASEVPKNQVSASRAVPSQRLLIWSAAGNVARRCRVAQRLGGGLCLCVVARRSALGAAGDAEPRTPGANR